MLSDFISKIFIDGARKHFAKRFLTKKIGNRYFIAIFATLTLILYSEAVLMIFTEDACGSPQIVNLHITYKNTVVL